MCNLLSRPFTFRLEEKDQRHYASFDVVVSDRWQKEVMETIFVTTNAENDRGEEAKKNKVIHSI